MRLRYFLTIAAAALALSACGGAAMPSASAPAASAGSIQIVDAWARAASSMSGAMGQAQPTGAAMGDMKPTGAAMGETGGANGAMYMTSRNSGGAADKLIKAQSDVAKSVELHTVVNDGGVMKMRPVEAIEVPAGGETALKPGGFHVMLIGLTRDLKPGDKVAFKLQFANAGTVDVQAEVRQQ